LDQSINAALTYDYYNILKELNIESSKETLIGELTTKEFKSSSGLLKFDEKGDVIREFHLYKINNTHVKKIEEMGPFNKIILII